MENEVNRGKEGKVIITIFIIILMERAKTAVRVNENLF